MYFFFDTETTGLSKNSDHIVQIAWIVADGDGEVVSEKEFIIRPDGFTIPTQAAQIHGITTRRALDEGVPIADALEELLSDTEDVACVVAHNAQFDLAILRRECIDNDYAFPFDGVLPICTMRSSTQYCRLAKLNGANGYKWPTLEELHFHLFGAYFDGSHDALADTRACMRCFYELLDLGVIAEFKSDRNYGRPSEIQNVPTVQMLAKKIEELRSELETERLKTVRLQERIDYLESEEGLFSLALRSNDSDWLIAVAGHPNASPEVIDEVRELAEFYDEARIYLAIAGNPVAPSELIHELVLSQNYEDGSLMEAAVSNPSTGGNTLCEICWHTDFSLYPLALNNPSFSAREFHSFLEEKIWTGDYEYKLWISQFDSCPDDLLLQLSEDSNPSIREAVASNKNCPVAALSHLSFDEIESVRSAAEANPKHIFQRLKKSILLGDLDAVFKIMADKETSALKHVVESVAPHNSEDGAVNEPLRHIRFGLATNVQTHPDILDALSKCSEARLREEVALNERCPAIVLNRLANDPEIRVRIAAKHRIKAS